jgi:hypothetical protein
MNEKVLELLGDLMKFGGLAVVGFSESPSDRRGDHIRNFSDNDVILLLDSNNLQGNKFRDKEEARREMYLDIAVSAQRLANEEVNRILGELRCKRVR